MTFKMKIRILEKHGPANTQIFHDFPFCNGLADVVGGDICEGDVLMFGMEQHPPFKLQRPVTFQ